MKRAIAKRAFPLCPRGTSNPLIRFLSALSQAKRSHHSSAISPPASICQETNAGGAFVDLCLACFGVIAR